METQLLNWKVNKITIIKLKNKFFRNIASFLDYINENTVIFTRNSEALFSKLDFEKSEEIYNNLNATVNMSPRNNYF
jgi:transcription-repair coupling factor (superfamily II helicase)